MENLQRPKVNFHPDVWGDAFLKCPDQDIDAAAELQHEQMKQEIRRMLVANKESLNQRLSLIDDVQRLGVSYHFEKEIEDELENIHHEDYDENDLYTTALRFRLLREHGFNVSCEIFNKFKDEQGNFKSSLTSDVRGLLELYEASDMRLHGEDILDEAISFTRTQLNLAILATLDYPLSEQVAHALQQSIRRGFTRVEARRYISIYQDFDSHNKILLEFAKLDFNLVQLLHKKELSGICTWWKDFDLKMKLPFTRERVVECYFWILGVYFEPRYAVARWMMTKVMAMASIVDDVYDSYGTYEELLLYTDAISRWDIKCMDQLPDYMKISCYKALLDVYEEMKELLADEEKEYRIEYAKKAWIPVAQAFLLEKKWMQQKLKPTFEEYKANALVTCGYAMLTVTAYVGMGNVVTKETFDWALIKSPKIIRASEIICRFMDDVAEHKFKHKGEDDCCAIECYMAEYGVSAQEAYDEFYKHVENAWKDINEEFLKPTAMPMEVLNRSLNLARVMDVLYKDGDGYTYVGKVTKDGITSLLVDPIPL